MLDRCPRCEYSLSGLPDFHRCPECGLDYELDSASFAPSGGARSYMILGSVLLLTNLGFCFGLFGNVKPGGWLGGWALAIIAIRVGVGRWLMRNRRIIVSRKQLRVFHGNGKEQSFEMPLICRARWRFTTGETELVSTDGQVIDTLPAAFLGSHRDMQRVARAITAYAAPLEECGSGETR